MTFFLNPTPQKAQPTEDRPLSPFLTALGAATSQMMQDTNASFQRQRQIIEERDRVAFEIAPKLGGDAVRGIFDERNRRARDLGLMSKVVEPPADLGEMVKAMGPLGSARILEAARADAIRNPEAWRGVDLSEDGIQTRVTERRKADDAEWEATVSMYPGSQTAVRLMGGLIGGTADVRNLPFLIAGATGGSLLKIMAIEGGLNAAAEAVTLPSQYDVAKELGKPDPKPVQQIALGAVAGAAIGGAVHGLTRAAVYFSGRSRTPKLPDYDPATSEVVVDTAEQAIATDANPLDAVEQVLREAPVERRPLIPEDTAPDDSIVVSALPKADGQPPGPLPDNLVIQQARQAIEKSMRGAKPKRTPQRLLDFIVKRGGFWLGDENVGDVKAIVERMPGLYKKAPFLRSSGGDNFGGRSIDEMREAAVGAGFLDPDASINDLFEAIRRDAVFKDVYSREDATLVAEWRAYHQAREDATRELERLHEQETAAQDYVARNREADGFYVEPGMDDAGIAAGLDGLLSRQGLTLLPRERTEILAKLKQDGGEAQFLVESAMSRELDDIEYAWLRGEDDGSAANPVEADRPANGASEPGAGASRQSEAAAADAGGSAAGGGQRGGDAQARIPGTEVLATGKAARDRATIAAQSQQSKIRRLDQTRVEDDAGGLFGGAQRDMFDEPGGQKAREFLDQKAADLREQIGMPTDRTAKPDPDSPKYLDTRGKGQRYHGSRSADLDKGIYEGAYSTQNIYGQGFYTTDAAAIAKGYDKGGGFYTVREVAPINAFDLEGPIPDWLIAGERGNEIVDLALEGVDAPPKNVRELYDEVRAASTYLQVGADEAQGIFEGFEQTFLKKGFNALDHKGGLNTKKAPHQVRIYLEPWKDIKVERSTPPAAPPAKPANDFDVDLGDGKGVRKASEVLNDLDAGDKAADRLALCGGTSEIPF